MLILVTLALALAAPTAATQFIPSDAAFHTFDTPHFRVTFTPGLEDIARRAGSIGEWAYSLLSEEFLPPPPGRIELVLANNVDFANGTASVIPRNRIFAYVHPPAGDPNLGFHEDWLELLILHELVHIFHLENSGGIWPDLRRIFGRNPALYPQFLTPGWLVEGIATYIESAYTAAGRVRGASFDMMMRAAALEDFLFEIDRATLDPIVWPAGMTRYVYGAFFIDHLSRQYEEGSVPALVESMGRRLIPYRIERSARGALGTTLSEAWELWTDSLRHSYLATAEELRAKGLTQPDLLTDAGWFASFPRFSPDGQSIAYTAMTGRDQPSLRILSAGGSEAGIAPVSRLGPSAWSADGREIIYAELEFAGPNELYSDLHLVSPGSAARRLTRGERVWEPDLHPQGDRAVVVASATGTNVLAVYDLTTGEIRRLTAPDPDAYWSTPRWSPDGSRIAAGHWRAGQLDLVVLDHDGELVLQVTSDVALDSEPAWSPDGRYLLFASDRTGISNIFAYDFLAGELRQVTNVLTGAFQPDVSPNADQLVFSFYRSDGYHIALVPFEPTSWRPAPPAPTAPASLASAAERSRGEEQSGPVRRYSAWPSVLPTHWSPVLANYRDLGVGIGLTTGGSDVLEKHQWSAELLAYPGGARVDGGLVYRYRGWGRPVLDIIVQQEWRVRQAPLEVTDNGSQPALLRRDREVEAVFTWRRPRFRSLGWLETGGDLRKIDLLWSDDAGEAVPDLPRLPLDLGGIVGAGITTVQGYERSLGPQEGVQIAGRLEGRRRLEAPTLAASDRNYWRITSRGLAFRGFDWFGFAPSVVAARLDAGVEGSASTIGFTAGGGGGGGGDSDDRTLLRGGTNFPVRGYPTGAQGGNRAFSGSLEYRFPIALVERGFRLLPLAVDRLWGDLFMDIGAAWCPDSCAARAARVPASPRPLLSIGAETILALRFGYFFDVPLRFGVAFPVREVDAVSPEVFLKVGRSF